MELTELSSYLHHRKRKNGPDSAVSSSSDPASELGDMENNEFLVYSYVSKKLDNIENLLDKMEALRKESDEADARFAQLRPYKAFACVSGHTREDF
ncbi:hypothetical protein OsI_31307 [Oryza sativa Indica Group]|uniref:Uncharacterized protein n=1 Tax=Oryza sativa subsp. indica TaxID=39946 RepID=A2Z136_ORYSI|nr:hypothetical protein OsI_31307 [Oryza sativa Indica Group]